MKKSFFSPDPIQERRDEIEKIENTEYTLPKRTDMTKHIKVGEVPSYGS